LITARDMGVAPAPPMQAHAVALRERILLMVLYVTVLASSVAFIEPSPHDALMGVLAITCLVAGVRFERILALPLLLLLLWNVAGIMSLLNVVGEEKTIQYAGTSVYLAVAAMLFACLFAQNTMPRMAVMRAAYVLTAVMVALAGIAGYFHLFPHAYELFAPFGRALGAFKDPNVFGPFLIWPALVVLERMLVRRTRITDVMIVGIMLLGLLLSFSRGAWFHFAVSCAVMIGLAFLAAPTQALRLRIFSMSAVGVVALAAFIAILLSFEAISDMFQERAQLVQSYDAGQGGRFQLQELALTALLKFPNGMGPFEFSRVHGLQQHNVYLQAFLVYGWTGGMAYLLLLVATLWVAFRCVFLRTPWQPYLITALAAFVGEVVEGFVIDTDHWRHFFLLLGIIWGLGAATVRETRHKQALTSNEQACHVRAA
jgi:O-antigen ligase